MSERQAEQEAKISGYVDPRTGEYKRATEANREEVLDDLGFIMAWKFFWEGPVERGAGPIMDRETWLASGRRLDWLDALTDEQRSQLAQAPPPEEVPALQGDDEG